MKLRLELYALHEPSFMIIMSIPRINERRGLDYRLHSNFRIHEIHMYTRS